VATSFARPPAIEIARVEPARALAAETLTLERTLSDLVNQAYGLTPAEIALMWQNRPPRACLYRRMAARSRISGHPRKNMHEKQNERTRSVVIPQVGQRLCWLYGVACLSR